MKKKLFSICDSIRKRNRAKKSRKVRACFKETRTSVHYEVNWEKDGWNCCRRTQWAPTGQEFPDERAFLFARNQSFEGKNSLQMATVNKFDRATIKAAYISSELTDQFMLERNRATSFFALRIGEFNRIPSIDWFQKIPPSDRLLSAWYGCFYNSLKQQHYIHHSR